LSRRQAAARRRTIAKRRRRTRRIRRALALILVVVGIGAAYGAVEWLSEPSRPSLASVPSAPPAVPADAVAAPCTPDPALTAPPVTTPPSIANALASPRLAADSTGVSIWIEGIGEVATLQPDRSLLPASNEKLLTAMGALAVLGPDSTFVTTARATGPVVGGTLTGDLVLVGGGDPTVRTEGDHSLEALAGQVEATGITRVTGRLLVDESRFDSVRRAAGWEDSQYPANAGPISALMVNRNRHRNDAEFLADPALGNAELFREALAGRGVLIAGPTEYGTAPDGSLAAGVLTSAPVTELVDETLLRSDNMIAEMLVKEAGYRATGIGSTAGGLLAITDALNRAFCTTLDGVADDGSGLSRADLRSAREWRVMLQAARSESWWPQFDAGLPVAGRTGTLSGRMRGTAAEANVRAKTGTIRGAVSLSGHGTTAGGRAFVFSVVVNGDSANGSESAIDGLVAAVASYQG
jgi:serine-type D-Ala-D-Ala carboxypeptidase/endopeptidase (penicillin-binding protein 4)